jgi:uncharacterized protein (DUF305 family)
MPDPSISDRSPAAPTPEAPTPAPGRSGTPWWVIALFVVALCGLAGIIGWRVADSGGSSRPAADSVDVGFATDMTYHHQQALVMALDYVRNGTDPLLLQIAREIVEYQAQEIGVMNTLLTEWGHTGLDSGKAMAWMGTPIPRQAMPGLATQAQMDQLAAARGAELDDLFTRLMIEHHAGGIHMADYAAPRAGEDTTRYWATNMADAQRGEIAEMNRWRRAHGLEPVVPQYITNDPPTT